MNKYKLGNYFYSNAKTAIIGLILLGVIISPVAFGQETEDVSIGVVLPTSSTDQYINIVSRAQNDINSYMESQGSKYRFSYLIDQADGQAAVHLEKVQGFKSMGVNLVIGGAWSSMAQAALSYVDDNDMLLLSWSSTSPLLAISDDNLFRMCPDDLYDGFVISREVLSYGLEGVVVIHRGDAWGDMLYNLIESELEEKDVIVYGQVRYPADTEDFVDYLGLAEEYIEEVAGEYGVSSSGVIVLGFNEVDTITYVVGKYADSYPFLNSVNWFCQRVLPEEKNNPMDNILFCTNFHEPGTSRYAELDSWYRGRYDVSVGFYNSALYDSCWALALAVYRGDSTDTESVMSELYRLTDFEGASGRIVFGDDGDREQVDYGFWEVIGWDDVLVGFFEGRTGWVYWDQFRVDLANSPPVVDVNGPYSGLVDEEIDFSSDGSWDPDGSDSWMSYLWWFGDGWDSLESDPGHSFYEAGEYIVDLRAADYLYSANMAYTRVIVETPLMATSLSISVSDTRIDSYDPIIVSARVLDNFGDPMMGVLVDFTVTGVSGSLERASGYTGDDGFVYTVWESSNVVGTATISVECDSLSDSATVTVVNQAPVADITSFSPVSPDLGQSVSFTGEASDPENHNLRFEWSSNRDGSIGEGRTIRHVLSEGSHRISLRVVDTYGGSDTDSVSISVIDQTPPRIESLDYTPMNVDSSTPVSVTARVSDNGEVDSVSLRCCIDQEETESISMQYSGGLYHAVLPAQSSMTRVSLQLTAVDEAGNQASQGPIAYTVSHGLLDLAPAFPGYSIVVSGFGAVIGWVVRHFTGGFSNGTKPNGEGSEPEPDPRPEPEEDEEHDRTESGYDWMMIPPLKVNAGGRGYVGHFIRNKSKVPITGVTVELGESDIFTAKPVSSTLNPYRVRILPQRVNVDEDAEGFHLMNYSLSLDGVELEKRFSLVKVQHLHVGLYSPESSNLETLLETNGIPFTVLDNFDDLSGVSVLLLSGLSELSWIDYGKIVDFVSEHDNGLVVLDRFPTLSGDPLDISQEHGSPWMLLGYQGDKVEEFNQGSGLRVSNKRHSVTRFLKRGLGVGLVPHCGAAYTSEHNGVLLTQYIIKTIRKTVPGVVYSETPGRIVHFNFNLEACFMNRPPSEEHSLVDLLDAAVKWAAGFT